MRAAPAGCQRAGYDRPSFSRRDHRRTRQTLPRFHLDELKSIPQPQYGFPRHLHSVNHVVCHGIPGDKRLKTRHHQYRRHVIRDGFHGDTSRMYSSQCRLLAAADGRMSRAMWRYPHGQPAPAWATSACHSDLCGSNNSPWCANIATRHRPRLSRDPKCCTTANPAPVSS